MSAAFDALKRRALSLGAVKAFDHGMQFLLPVVLVRCLDTATFGEYRLLWLVVGTVMAVATLNMCGTLYFFMPRSTPARKRLYVHQTLLYLAVAGVVCGFLVSPWNPLLPPPVQPLEAYGALVPAFVALWLLGTLLDFVPTVDERIRWQAYATMSVSGLRALLVGVGAWVTQDLMVVLWLLLAVVVLKVGLILIYLHRHHGLGRPWFERAAFSEQFRHSAPLGLSNAFFGLRGQADQWVAASLFALSSFAAFSIAALVAQVVHIVRVSVLEVLLPSMSRLQAAGDVRGMLDMNRRGNVMVAAFLYPLLGFAFAFAEDLITLIYTASYAQAVPAVRLYILGQLAMVVEVGSLVMLLRQGPFALRVTGIVLCISVAVSFLAAQHFGLAGAAAGSVLATYIDRAFTLRRISRLTATPLARLQSWRALGQALMLAALSSALAWGVVVQFFSGSTPLVRLLIGAAVLASAYAATNLRGPLFRTRIWKEQAR
jgi:O-antigen/teichoic acid export membrane protein